MNFSESAKHLLETIRQYGKLLVYIKGSPDPDALAASYVIKVIAGAVGTTADILSPQRPSLPQNIRFIRDLQLPVEFKGIGEDAKKYDGYVITDHQSVLVEGLTGVIPCALHVDHHHLIAESIPVTLRLHAAEAGSTCTILAFLLAELKNSLDITPGIWKKMATALCFGIQTDTDNMQLAELLDAASLEKISSDCDWKLISNWTSLTFSPDSLRVLNQAWRNGFVYKDWFIAGLGFIDEIFRDETAVLADHLLKQKAATIVVIYFIVQSDKGLTLNASFRSADKNLDMNAIIKRIAKNGGARRFKGAFQVDLDYFKHSRNLDLLWRLVDETTSEALKTQRDFLEARYLGAFFNRIKERIKRIFA